MSHRQTCYRIKKLDTVVRPPSRYWSIYIYMTRVYSCNLQEIRGSLVWGAGLAITQVSAANNADMASFMLWWAMQASKIRLLCFDTAKISQGTRAYIHRLTHHPKRRTKIVSRWAKIHSQPPAVLLQLSGKTQWTPRKVPWNKLRNVLLSQILNRVTNTLNYHDWVIDASFPRMCTSRAPNNICQNYSQ